MIFISNLYTSIYIENIKKTKILHSINSTQLKLMQLKLGTVKSLACWAETAEQLIMNKEYCPD